MNSKQSLLRAVKLTTIFAIAGVVGVMTVSCGSNPDAPTPPPGEEAGTPIDQPDATGEQDSATPDAGPFLEAGPCVPQPIDCTNKCGPVRDACSGEVKLCGGCPATEVCDLQTHTCGVPKVTCEDFGAQCGRIKTSCGEYRSCGDCPSGQECNPDTNQCQPAQPVTCADLGYECGAAWLGAGSILAKTNCGTCGDAAKPRCNAAYNKCEPACTAPWKVVGLSTAQQNAAKQAFCDAARQTKGVECGFISDGCGGTIDCSAAPVTGFKCAAGQGCGVRGVANRCEPFPTPPECEALGRNCGELVSVCTGLKIQCGACSVAGEVCNDNGVCGPPCTLKTCATALPAGQACGNPSDGCNGTLNCRCPGNGACQANGTCCVPKTCTELLASGKTCGKQLDNGCGGKVDCNCVSGQLCVEAANDPADNGDQGTCCQRRTCAFYAGQCGTDLPDGCGGPTLDCGCQNGGTCIVGGPPGSAAPPGTPGMCCNETNCPSGQCGSTVASVCISGQQVPCPNCPNGQVCNNMTCCQPTGGCSATQCNTTVDRGCGLPPESCNCQLPFVCNGTTCECTPTACQSNQCGNISNGCNGTVNCGNCAGGNQVCINNSCCTPTSTCPAGFCGTHFDGCRNIQCDPCTGGQVCNASAGGVCCNPKTCAADYPGQCGQRDNGCGGTLNCNCNGSAAGPTCNPVTDSCCTKLTCNSPAYQNKCGTFPDGCNTGNISCGCNGFNTCGGGGQAGVCGCTKKTCADYPGGVGPQPDGCGGQTESCGG